MSEIIVSGYYGFGNAGDEAMLEGMVQSFRQLSPGIKITVLSANPTRTSREHGVRSISRLNVWAIRQEMARARLLISGGGSLLQDVTGVFNIPYYLWIISLAVAMRKPVMLYGQGIGPVRTRLGRFLMEATLSRVDLITVRDEASQRELEELGVTGPPTVVTADPVFALFPFLSGSRGKEPSPDLDQAEDSSGATGIGRVWVGEGDSTRTGEANGGKRRDTGEAAGTERGLTRRIGISVRKWSGQGFLGAVARAADHLIEEMGYSVVFLPMQYPDDIDAARQVAGAMRNQAEIVTRRLDFRTAIRLIGGFDLLVGMRLHALVFAALVGVPMVGVSYDPKIDGFLAQMGLTPAGSVVELKAEDILIRAEEALHNREAISGDLLRRSEELSHQALRNTELALGLLGKK